MKSGVKGQRALVELRMERSASGRTTTPTKRKGPSRSAPRPKTRPRRRLRHLQRALRRAVRGFGRGGGDAACWVGFGLAAACQRTAGTWCATASSSASRTSFVARAASRSDTPPTRSSSERAAPAPRALRRRRSRPRRRTHLPPPPPPLQRVWAARGVLVSRSVACHALSPLLRLRLLLNNRVLRPVPLASTQ